MGLISTEVEVILNSTTIKYYEDLGYEILRYKDKNGRMKVKKGTKITIKVKDLKTKSDTKIKVKCDECGNEYIMMYKDYNRYNHDGKIYCNKCANTVLLSGKNNPNYGGKTSKRGKNHHNWNPNKTDEERKIDRNYIEYATFVKRVLKRDNYTCQCCKKHDENLQVHHLDSYNWCKEKRTDDTNGITLCSRCHENFHSIYGRGDNTKEQFEEWFGHAVELIKYEGELNVTRKIYCIEEDKVYDGAMELSKALELKNESNIYACCNRKHKYKSIKGKHLVWLDEWESWNNKQKEEWKKWAFNSKTGKKKVICLETGVVYESIANAENITKINGSTISSCCIGRYKSAGKLEDGTKLHWMYYDEYLKIYNKE